MGTEKITLSNKHLSCGPKGKDKGEIMLCIVESIHKGPETRYISYCACRTENRDRVAKKRGHEWAIAPKKSRFGVRDHVVSATKKFVVAVGKVGSCTCAIMRTCAHMSPYRHFCFSQETLCPQLER